MGSVLVFSNQFDLSAGYDAFCDTMDSDVVDPNKFEKYESADFKEKT